MKPKNPSEFTDEQLLRTVKLAKGTLISFSVIFVLMLCTCLYITVTKGFGVFTILPLTFFPILITNIITYRKTQDEAKKRNLI
ncbi:hypothetical protein [Epilithonimonas xixisoli]|uniref:Redox-active disulfide protein 2 n=1 Tax=Epilithonimonas xixisoli TaxID=1476462 RepID=A0A4R8I445_9FLAO|nr:hypothetical protein [Epilithonimonas xixisoli]TDX83033.1 hypothetical protein B0I22_3089 [Epilithonimonas xixisoli]